MFPLAFAEGVPSICKSVPTARIQNDVYNSNALKYPHNINTTDDEELEEGSQKMMKRNSRKVSFQISARNSDQMFQLNNVRTTEALILPTQSFMSADLKYLPHLKNLPLAKYVNKQPAILIGLDNYQLMAPQRAIEGKWEDPVAIETRIGWTVLGTVNPPSSEQCTPVNLHTKEDDLHNLVKGFF